MKAFIRNARDVNPVCPPNHEEADSWHLVTPKTGGSDTVEFFLTEIRPGGVGMEDIHDREDHVFFILGGRGYAVIDGERFNFGSGDALFIPRKSTHEFHVEGKETLRFIGLCAPARKG